MQARRVVNTKWFIIRKSSCIYLLANFVPKWNFDELIFIEKIKFVKHHIELSLCVSCELSFCANLIRNYCSQFFTCAMLTVGKY